MWLLRHESEEGSYGVELGGQVVVVDLDRAWGGLVDAAEHEDSGGLTGAVVAEQPRHLALVHVER